MSGSETRARNDRSIGRIAANLPDATQAESTDALIDLILSRYHEVHRRELRRLIALAKAVECGHADHPSVPVGLSTFLSGFAADLDGHMVKEERMLFPIMRAGGHPAIGMPIACMRHEHQAHAESVAQLIALTREYAVPDDACDSWRALYAGLSKLEGELIAHIHLENDVLFRRFVA